MRVLLISTTAAYITWKPVIFSRRYGVQFLTAEPGRSARHTATISLGERWGVAVIEPNGIGPTSRLAPVASQQCGGTIRVDEGIERRRRWREGGAVPMPVYLHATNVDVVDAGGHEAV